MKKLVLSAAVAASALFAALPAQAVVVPNDSQGLIFDPFVPATQGTFLASQTTPANAITFNSLFRSAVYRNTTGTLDFYYQVSRLASSPTSNEIRSFTVNNFAGFTVDAFVSPGDPDGAGIFLPVNNTIDGPASTTTVGRGPDGAVLRTEFGTNGLRETETSATYIFRTNATTFNNLGTFGVINGSAISGLTYQPLSAAIPEPATWAMMIGGFGMVGGAMRRARKVKMVAA